MEKSVKRWTATRKSALGIAFGEGKTSRAEASRTFDLTRSEVEAWVEDAREGMERAMSGRPEGAIRSSPMGGSPRTMARALKANPRDFRQQDEKRHRDLQDAYGEVILELRARKSCRPSW